MRKRKPSINHRVSSISSEYDHWMPSIREGLLLNAPFRFNNKILYSAASDTDLRIDIGSLKLCSAMWGGVGGMIVGAVITSFVILIFRMV